MENPTLLYEGGRQDEAQERSIDKARTPPLLKSGNSGEAFAQGLGGVGGSGGNTIRYLLVLPTTTYHYYTLRSCFDFCHWSDCILLVSLLLSLSLVFFELSLFHVAEARLLLFGDTITDN